MNDPLPNKLREAGWRRKLTAAEAAELSAWLEAHPEMRSDWAAETSLNDLLGKLPDAPVPSNFTARVLHAAELEAAADARRREESSKWSWRSLLRRTAVAMVLLVAGLFSLHLQNNVQRNELAQGVAAVADVASLPSPDILQDFEAVRQLNSTPPADEELLALLQ